MDKQKLILLHGALGSQQQLEPLKLALESQFDISTLDFEGHGNNVIERDYSMDYFATNLEAHISSLDLKSEEKVHIFGYSMGGYVALLSTLNGNQYISKIATLGTKFAWSPEAAANECKHLNADKILAKVPKFADMLDKRHQSDWKLVLEKTAGLLKSLGENPLLTIDNIKDINIPVLIQIGDQDHTVSIDESQTIANSIEQGHFKVMPETLHPLEKVDIKLLASNLAIFFNQ